MKRALSSTTIAILALLATLVVATPAQARVFVVQAHSTELGCNSEAQVLFGVEISHGEFDKVHDFAAREFNYPNYTPPIPVGNPSGNCIPGETDAGDGLWVYLNTGFASDSAAGHHYSLPFGKGGLNRNEFGHVWRDRYQGVTYQARSVYGKVRIDRVGRRHHRKWKLTAHGYFVKAQSEAGLDRGGPSSGRVDWEFAHRYG
jgi:hypothetical protein